MSGSQLAVFTLDSAGRPGPFLAWATLVGPQVALLHLPKGDKKARDGRACRCEVYEGGVAEQAVDATVQRTAVVRSAPRFLFLDSSAAVPPTQVSDPRFWSADLDEVRTAMWEFVEAEARLEPAHTPSPTTIETPTNRVAETGTTTTTLGAGGKPWWCKMFRTGPGC
jgi:hypothetical protein